MSNLTNKPHENSANTYIPQTADGVLVIDKPADWTSHDVVAKMRKILRTRRVGHTGTLDPFATGVLVVCVNQATRLVQYLTGDDKEYVATVRLGWATDTGDFTGTPTTPKTDARQITDAQITAALAPFRGRLQQVPPMYSAKKIGGQKLYELARRGKEVERPPVEIEIKALALLSATEAANWYVRAASPEAATDPLAQDFHLRVVCSAGTYIRTLAEDIGKQLGIGAHLTALRRIRAGHCPLSQAVTLEQLAALCQANELHTVLVPMAEAVVMPHVTLTEDECKAISFGRSIRRQGNWAQDTPAKLCDANGNLLAIAAYEAEKQAWQPRAVLYTS